MSTEGARRTFPNPEGPAGELACIGPLASLAEPMGSRDLLAPLTGTDLGRYPDGHRGRLLLVAEISVQGRAPLRLRRAS